MQKSPHSTQDPPKKIAETSILDMDSNTLAKEFENFSFTPNSEKIIYASSNSDPLNIDFKTLSSLGRDQTVREIESVKKAFYSLATSVQISKINEIEVITKAIPVQVERLYEDLNKEIKEILSQPKYITLNTDRLAQIFIDEDPDKVMKAIEALATNENKKNIDKAKLLIYGQLIDKIEETDSGKIKIIYDKILDLKFKEVTLKKFLPPKEKTPAKIDVKPLFAEMPPSNTPIISQPKKPSPLSILLQTPSFDNEQKIKLDQLKNMPAESAFPIKKLDPQQYNQNSGEPPLPPEVAKLAMVFAENNLARQALKASQAEVIEESKRLEGECNQLTQQLRQLEEIKQRNKAFSDSIPLDMPNLQEIRAREEELKRVLEEKQRQEDITRIEAWKIEQELTIQEALHRKQDGKILGLRPGQKPEIGTYQNQLKDGIGDNPFPHHPSGIKKNISAVPWDQKYLANLRGEEFAAIKAQQKAPSPPLSQGLYPPPNTLNDLQALGAGPSALALGNTPAPVHNSLLDERTLATAQHPQVNAPPFDQVVSPRKLPAGTSSIFTQAYPQENLTTFEYPGNHRTQSSSDVDRLSADQLLGGFQVEFPEPSEDLTKSNQIKKPENQITESSYTQPTFNLTSENNSLELADHQPQTPFPFAISSENLTRDPQFQGELGLSAQQSDVPPPPPRDEFHASSISPSLNLGGVEQNIPPTMLCTKEEKNNFWQTFISTRLATRTSTPIQYSPRNNEDDSNQDQLDARSQSSSSALELESLEGSSTPRSTSSYLTTEKGKTDETYEIEERKKRLYTILLANLEEQITKESGADSNNKMQSDPILKDEEENTAEMNEENAKTIIETVMTHIATYTSNLASSISKVENNQTEGAHQSEASDSQIIQNSSNEDPIIYSGIGIRIKLEKEGENLSLKITEVFENSGLDQDDVNKKITHIRCGDELKSISDIYQECGNDEEKFYTKISLIFRDEKQRTLSLKIEGEKQERTVEKNIFIPSEKKVLNVKNNSQMTRIADKLSATRQISRQLTPRESSRTA